MPSHRLTRPLAAGIAALALAAPAAQARPAQDRAVLPSAHHTIAAHGVAQKAPVDSASRSSAPQVRSTDTGFDVTSAAVGAAGLGLIALLAVGTTTLTARRRMRPTA
jgi:hypothetical protein